jgi:hypothetical protein
MNNIISGKTILTSWHTERSNHDLSDRALLETLIEAVVAECDKHELLPVGYGLQLEAFMYDLFNDQRATCWQRLAREGKKRIEFIKSMHPYIKHPLLAGFGNICGQTGVGVVPENPLATDRKTSLAAAQLRVSSFKAEMLKPRLKRAPRSKRIK